MLAAAFTLAMAVAGAEQSSFDYDEFLRQVNLQSYEGTALEAAVKVQQQVGNFDYHADSAIEFAQEHLILAESRVTSELQRTNQKILESAAAKMNVSLRSALELQGAKLDRNLDRTFGQVFDVNKFCGKNNAVCIAAAGAAFKDAKNTSIRLIRDATQNQVTLTRISDVVESAQKVAGSLTIISQKMSDVVTSVQTFSDQFNSASVTGTVAEKFAIAQRCQASAVDPGCAGLSHETIEGVVTSTRFKIYEGAQGIASATAQYGAAALSIADALNVEVPSGLAKGLGLISAGASIAAGVASGNPIAVMSGLVNVAGIFGKKRASAPDPTQTMFAAISAQLTQIQNKLKKIEELIEKNHREVMDTLAKISDQIKGVGDRVDEVYRLLLGATQNSMLSACGGSYYATDELPPNGATDALRVMPFPVFNQTGTWTTKQLANKSSYCNQDKRRQECRASIYALSTKATPTFDSGSLALSLMWGGGLVGAPRQQIEQQNLTKVLGYLGAHDETDVSVFSVDALASSIDPVSFVSRVANGKADATRGPRLAFSALNSPSSDGNADHQRKDLMTMRWFAATAETWFGTPRYPNPADRKQVLELVEMMLRVTAFREQLATDGGRLLRAINAATLGRAAPPTLAERRADLEGAPSSEKNRLAAMAIDSALWSTVELGDASAFAARRADLIRSMKLDITEGVGRRAFLSASALEAQLEPEANGLGLCIAGSATLCAHVDDLENIQPMKRDEPIEELIRMADRFDFYLNMESDAAPLHPLDEMHDKSCGK